MRKHVLIVGLTVILISSHAFADCLQGNASDSIMWTNCNVGIGTSTPQAKLEASGLGRIALDAANAFFWVSNPTAPNSYSGANYDRLGLGFGWNGGNVALITTEAAGTGTLRPIRIFPQGTNGIYLGTNGNVGVNTLAPHARLEIAGTNKIAMDTAYGFLWVSNSTAPNSYDGPDYDRLGVGYSGNVGIIRTEGAGTGTTRPLQITTGGNNGIYVTTAGTVGINTTSPGATLDVNGSIRATSVIGAVYQDLAEWVPATSEMDAGTVVVLNPEKSNEVMRSANEYDTSVAGVISARPGILLGEAAASKAKVATIGRVKVHVDASKTPIRIGDLLVTSNRPGVAMRSEPLEVAGAKIHRPGTVIGKALEPLGSGEGDILVLLSLQ